MGNHLSEIHELPIIGTADPGRGFLFDSLCVSCVDEVSMRAIVSDQTAGLLAGVQHLLRMLAKESRKHLRVMLVAKYVKILSRTGTPSLLFTGHIGDRLGAVDIRVYEQFAAHWHPGDPAVEVS